MYLILSARENSLSKSLELWCFGAEVNTDETRTKVAQDICPYKYFRNHTLMFVASRNGIVCHGSNTNVPSHIHAISAFKSFSCFFTHVLKAGKLSAYAITWKHRSTYCPSARLLCQLWMACRTWQLSWDANCEVLCLQIRVYTKVLPRNFLAF